MGLFLLTFFLLYGGLHYYIFTKVWSAFLMGTWAALLLVLFLLLMVTAPITVYHAEKCGFYSFARLFAYAGYTWMGTAFLFFACSILIDLYRLLLAAGGKLIPAAGSLSLSFFWQFMIPLLFALTAATYGIFEARDIRTERLVIRSPKIPREASPLKIAQISDVHLGFIVQEDRLSRIIREVKKADPDIFISTGDLVDGQIGRLNGLSELLEEIRPKHGKFAITGNHEYYAGLKQALEFTRRAGFTMLRGEGLTIAGINLAGVDDPAGEAYGENKGLPEKELLASLPREKFTLFLKHRPVLEPGSPDLFDLQISGHTHNGQIFPFRLLTRIFFPYAGGFFKLSNQSFLYVSRGSGTWGPPIRFLTPPEVTLYELVCSGK